LTKAFSTNATRYSTISLLFLLSVYLGPQAWALPRTGDAWSRKWTQALMLATSAHCAISSGHPSMRAFQMRRAATDSASGNHRISRPVAVAVKAVALAAGFTRRRLCG
jgi:hypothetical protein